MKIKNLKNKGFSRLSVFVIIVILVSVFFLVSCSGSEDNNAPVKTEDAKEGKKDISDSSREFAGNITQTTCLECHPEVKDGGFNIDFKKVTTSSVAHSKNIDEENKATGESGK